MATTDAYFHNLLLQMSENGHMPHHDIPRVLAAEGISNFGSMLSRLAIPWLAALTLHVTPLQMASLLIANVAAGAVSALFLGGWVDRRGKRQSMLLADGVRCVLLLVPALVVAKGFVSFTLLIIVSAASGIFTMAFELARSAWMAQRVDVADLPRRNAQLSVVGSLPRLPHSRLAAGYFRGLARPYRLLLTE